jgi:phosphoglycolate phosphatase
MFDLDGTLVDSSLDITNALNHAIAPYGIKRLSVEQTKSLVGEGPSRLIEKVVGPYDKALAGDVLAGFVDYYSRHLTDSTRPYPGIKETLERLGGYKKAVISNKIESMSRQILDELGMTAYFDAVLGSDSVEETKPSPKPLFQVMKMFSVGPDESVMVGDSSFDIEAGKAAGTATVAVSYGFRPPDTLNGADFLIDAIDGLLPILKQLNS